MIFRWAIAVPGFAVSLIVFYKFVVVAHKYGIRYRATISSSI